MNSNEYQNYFQAIKEIKKVQQESMSFEPASVCSKLPSLLSKEYKYFILDLVLNRLLEYRDHHKDLNFAYIVPVIFSALSSEISGKISSLYKRDPDAVANALSKIYDIYDGSSKYSCFVDYLTSVCFPNIYLHFITSAKCKAAADVIISIHKMEKNSLFLKLASSFFVSYLPFVQAFYSRFDYFIFRKKMKELESAKIKKYMQKSFIISFQSVSEFHKDVIACVLKCDNEVRRNFIESILDDLIHKFQSSKKLSGLFFKISDLIYKLVEEYDYILAEVNNHTFTKVPDIERDILESGVCFITHADFAVLQVISGSGDHILSNFLNQKSQDGFFSITEASYALHDAISAKANDDEAATSIYLNKWKGIQLAAEEDCVDPFSFLYIDDNSHAQSFLPSSCTDEEREREKLAQLEFTKFVIEYEKKRIRMFEEENNALRERMYSVTCLRNGAAFLRRILDDMFFRYSFNFKIESNLIKEPLKFPLEDKYVKDVNNSRHNTMVSFFESYLKGLEIFDKKECDKLSKGWRVDLTCFPKDRETALQFYKDAVKNKRAGFEEKLMIVFGWYTKLSDFQSLQIFKYISLDCNIYTAALKTSLFEKIDNDFQVDFRISYFDNDQIDEVFYEPYNILNILRFNTDNLNNIYILGLVEFVSSFKDSYPLNEESLEDDNIIKSYQQIFARMMNHALKGSKSNVKTEFERILRKNCYYMLNNNKAPKNINVFQKIGFPDTFIKNLEFLQKIL